MTKAFGAETSYNQLFSILLCTYLLKINSLDVDNIAMGLYSIIKVIAVTFTFLTTYVGY